MHWSQHLFDEDTLAVMIPIVAVLVVGIVGGTIAVVKLVVRHRERMAMIEQGLHPDYPPEVEDSEEETTSPP